MTIFKHDLNLKTKVKYPATFHHCQGGILVYWHHECILGYTCMLGTQQGLKEDGEAKSPEGQRR